MKIRTNGYDKKAKRYIPDTQIVCENDLMRFKQKTGHKMSIVSIPMANMAEFVGAMERVWGVNLAGAKE